ncbi:unnamed protein product [Lampetra planeri]
MIESPCPDTDDHYCFHGVCFIMENRRFCRQGPFIRLSASSFNGRAVSLCSQLRLLLPSCGAITALSIS